jgi:hypothetical protein
VKYGHAKSNSISELKNSIKGNLSPIQKIVALKTFDNLKETNEGFGEREEYHGMSQNRGFYRNRNNKFNLKKVDDLGSS